MPSYYPLDEILQRRNLKVQKLSIPLVVVGNATPASVSLSNDEPARVFLKSAAVDQITAALLTNETATYTTAAADATGIFQVLIRVNEQVAKVVGASCVSRNSAAAQASFLGSATGITTGSAGGTAIMLVVDSSVDFTGANTLNAMLEVQYIVAD